MNTLKKFRKDRGFTQQYVADYLNIGRSSYTKYESDTHVPDIYILDKLAALFDVTIDELIGRSAPAPAKENTQSEELTNIIKKLQGLSPSDIKEIESYIEFKHAKKNAKNSASNIG